MAIKKLQNNFTTPEQSKRLLELGVPAYSADCYLLNESQDTLAYANYRTLIIQPFHDKRAMFSRQTDFLPCWTVGRLIEISKICTTLPEEEYMFPFWYDTQDNVEWAIRVIESGVRAENIDNLPK